VPVRATGADFPGGGARGAALDDHAAGGNGPIDWKDRTAGPEGRANFKTALAVAKPADAFMTAASPGVIAHFLKNDHYPSREAYLARLATS